MQPFPNPFRPGAGQPPPHLAGRQVETLEFEKLLMQQPILKNLVLTGLRGVGKTVLLESFKPIAASNGWFWAGTDLSEAASISDHNMCIRILADLAPIVSSFSIPEENRKIGFSANTDKIDIRVSFQTLLEIYNSTPGLEADKLKNTLEFVWNIVKSKAKGIVLSYDEAQLLKDRATDKQYPLSLILEVIQYLQRKQIPYLLILTGLPTLVPNLIEARTYAERMFQITTLGKLTDEESKKAILTPIMTNPPCPVTFTDYGISEILRYSNGYPYFIQFFCKDAFDTILQQIKIGIELPIIHISDIVVKLDNDFYFGRWSRLTDRQKELLFVVAKLINANEEFTVKEITAKSEELLANPFKNNHINNTLSKLIELGLIYRNRHGKYSFAVPLLADYINRQELNEKNEDYPF